MMKESPSSGSIAVDNKESLGAYLEANCFSYQFQTYSVRNSGGRHMIYFIAKGLSDIEREWTDPSKNPIYVGYPSII